MDFTEQTRNANPRENANPCSVLFFAYTTDIFKKGYSESLDVDDLYSPVKSDESTRLGDRLETKWNQHVVNSTKQQKKPSLAKVLVQTFWPEYLYIAILLALTFNVFAILQPIMLRELLRYFESDSTKTRTDAFIYASAIVVCAFANAFFLNQYSMSAFQYGMRLRVACCALIYRKSLKLNRSVLTETGKVVNLLSNDVSRFDTASVFIHYMWVVPIQVLIVLYLLAAELGYAGLIGMVPIFLVCPVQAYAGKLTSMLRSKTARETDERVRLMEEIIAGIQVIKMYAWEKPIEKIIKLARKREIKIIAKLAYLRAISNTFILNSTRVALFCTLLTVVLLEKNITAATAFLCMSYFNILATTLTSIFVRGVSEVVELSVSIKRLQEFMLNEEFVDKITYPTVTNTKSILNLIHVTSKWNADVQENALTNFNVTIDSGALVGVIGTIGSGKTSLLLTILGELKVAKGSIEINGSISYASQDPWIFAATVRQNIVFGEVYEKKRYNDVVRVCCLEKDFQQFPDRDLTIVGERGTSLSGGQKARVNLARAVYRKADIYLLDDPLSAVDTRVGKRLYEECINNFLANKTRILVTHQVHYLKNADNIIILNNGCLEAQGTFQDLLSHKGYENILTGEQHPVEDEKKVEPNKYPRQIPMKGSRSGSITSLESETSLVDSLFQEDDDQAEITLHALHEDSSKKIIQGSIFMKYLLAGGNFCIVIFVILLVILTQVLVCGVDLFVSYWVTVEENRAVFLTKDDTMPDNFFGPATDIFLYMYGGLLITLIVVAVCRSLAYFKLLIRSSTKLHNTMFVRVIYTTMRFFETNPSGRILNRFSKDIGTIDELLPKTILDSSQVLLLSIGCAVLVAIVNAYLFIGASVIVILVVVFQAIFFKTAKNIKRLEGITRSPVFTQLNISLQGLSTIRACSAQEILKKEFDKHQDLHTSAWFMYIAASSALTLYIDFLCSIFITLVTFSIVTNTEKISGGSVGLAITQAIKLMGSVQFGMRQLTDVGNQLLSVERVLEYTLLPPEKQPDIPKTPKSNEWPTIGKISFQNVSLRYSQDSEAVLNNLNFTINAKEKIGIVGRTGAGKSSLISALFRLAIIEGEIEIDGISTKDLILQQLRSSVSIIPQDPVLFSGTLRSNLDPFEEYPDADLYVALRSVELKDASNTLNQLEHVVLDGGSNYSVGQRQLLCLARAIIRSNKILILDEATANVDPQTQAIIQKTVQEKFAQCTVITIAHRLDTIMNSDKVLVMDNGLMVEFNHPHLLLQNRKSVLYRMVAETGKGLMEDLRKVARQNYEQRNYVPE